MQIVKHLKINLKVKDLHTEKYYMGERKWRHKDILFLLIRRISIIKMLLVLKVFYRFNDIFIKFSVAFSQIYEKVSYKTLLESQKILIIQSNSEKEEKKASDFKLYYKTLLIKTCVTGISMYTPPNETA